VVGLSPAGPVSVSAGVGVSVFEMVSTGVTGPLTTGDGPANVFVALGVWIGPQPVNRLDEVAARAVMYTTVRFANDGLVSMVDVASLLAPLGSNELISHSYR